MIEELTALSARDLGLAGLVALAVTLIFLGWLVPYRLVRRSDYERTVSLLEQAQATNAENAQSLKAIAEHKGLAATVIEELRNEALTVRGSSQEEP